MGQFQNLWTVFGPAFGLFGCFRANFMKDFFQGFKRGLVLFFLNNFSEIIIFHYTSCFIRLLLANNTFGACPIQCCLAILLVSLVSIFTEFQPTVHSQPYICLVFSVCSVTCMYHTFGLFTLFVTCMSLSYSYTGMCTNHRVI